MAIVKMDHVRLIAMTEDREEILRRLQRLGCVEIDQAVLPADQPRLAEHLESRQHNGIAACAPADDHNGFFLLIGLHVNARAVAGVALYKYCVEFIAYRSERMICRNECRLYVALKLSVCLFCGCYELYAAAELIRITDIFFIYRSDTLCRDILRLYPYPEYE